MIKAYINVITKHKINRDVSPLVFRLITLKTEENPIYANTNINNELSDRIDIPMTSLAVEKEFKSEIII